jgi:hypothetical protein
LKEEEDDDATTEGTEGGESAPAADAPAES